jgi:hypothetical protein
MGPFFRDPRFDQIGSGGARPFNARTVRRETQAWNVRVIITLGKTGILNFFGNNVEIHVQEIPGRRRRSNLFMKAI